jgi:hypothetical protein
MIATVRTSVTTPPFASAVHPELESAWTAVRAGRGSLVLLVAWGLSGLGLMVAGAQPVNDHFEQRSPLVGTSVSLNASNVGATVDPDESLMWDQYWDRMESSVWWSWVAPTGGLLVVSIGTNDYPARFVAVYAGDALNKLQAPELGFTQRPSTAQPDAPRYLGVRVKSGVEYQLVVSGMNGATGEFPLRLRFFPTPANDDFANSEAMEGLEWEVEFSNTAATMEAEEPFIRSQPAGRSVWWSWTAPISGVFSAGLDPGPPIEADLTPGFPCSIEYELIVCTGDFFGTLRRTDSVRGTAGGATDAPAAWLSFTAEAGVTYHFRTDAAVAPVTRLTQRLVATARPEVMVTHPLKGQEWRVGDPVTIMAEARDPDGQIARVEFGDDGFADESWPYTRGLAGVAPGLHSLSVRAIDDRGVSSEPVEVTFTVRPVNDHFADRLPLTGAPLELTNTFAGASFESFESGEQSGGGSSGSEGSLWWAWTASSDALHTLSAVGLSRLAVYQGEQLEQLELVTSDSGGSEGGGGTGSSERKALWTAEAGQVYQLQAIGNAQSAADQRVLSIIRGAPPEVELTAPLQWATLIRGEPFELIAEADDLDGTIAEVAFYANGAWVGSVSQPPFTHTLVATQGDSLLLEAWAWDDSGLQSRSATVWVRVHAPPPPNDAFADRISLEGAPVTFEAELESANPDDFGEFWRRSAWWSWTPAVTGPHVIRVIHPGGWPADFGVYRGASLEELVPVVTSSWMFAEIPAHVGFHAEQGVVYAIVLYADGSGLTTAEILATALPTVAIVHPSESAQLSPGSIMQVEVAASDPEGKLARVDLYLNEGLEELRLLGSLEAPPFSWAVPLPQGEVSGSLYAVAVDQDGAMVVSDPRVFKVREALVNDAFADRRPLPPPGEATTADLRYATIEEGEPDPLGVSGTAWWTWEATSSEPFTLVVSSPGNYWPALSVFTGSTLGTLAELGSDNPRLRSGGPLARVSFVASAGTVYQFAVTGGETTTIQLVKSALPLARIVSPAANSTWVEGTPISVRVEAEDPEGAVREVTLFALWSPVATRREPPFEFVYVPPVLANSRALLLQARVTDAAGLWTMSEWVEIEVLPRRSSNDDFADRFELSGAFIRAIPEAGESSYESGEPRYGWSEGGSTWYSWRAPGTGLALVTLGPFVRSGATSLRVYTGTSPADLVEVVGDAVPDPGGSGGSYPILLQTAFLARAGLEYQIQLTDYRIEEGGAGGPNRLQLWFEPREVTELERSAEGVLSFRFTTVGERDWLVEGSTDARVWEPLGNWHSTGGSFRFVDPEAANRPMRLYRLSPIP